MNSDRPAWIGVAYWPALFAKLLETVGSRGGGVVVAVGGGPFLLQLQLLASASFTFACFLLSAKTAASSESPYLKPHNVV